MVTVMIRAISDAPADIPALLSPESTLGPYGRLRLLDRWVVRVRLQLCDPRKTREDLPGMADDLRRLVETISYETARIRASVPCDGGTPATLALLRCCAAGEDCELAEMFRRDAGRCAGERQAPFLTRMHAESSLRVVSRAIAHLRAALRFEEVDA